MPDFHAYPPEPKKQQTKNRHAKPDNGVPVYARTIAPRARHSIFTNPNPWELYRPVDETSPPRYPYAI